MNEITNATNYLTFSCTVILAGGRLGDTTGFSLHIQGESETVV